MIVGIDCPKNQMREMPVSGILNIHADGSVSHFAIHDECGASFHAQGMSI
ncbi:MAG: hypothetical protein RJS97_00550 [Parvibaculaceae bacterium]